MKSLTIAITYLFLLAAFTIVTSASNECDGNEGLGECGHYCDNSTGSYNCSCREGFNLNNDNKTCDDINECEDKGGLGDCTHSCNNFNGSYNCSCREGFSLSTDKKTCQDIDDCAAGNNGLGDCGHYCENSVGSYICSCREGFSLKADNKTCEDINECLANDGLGDCEHYCNNSEGSYGCSCKDDYSLMDDNKNCQDNMLTCYIGNGDIGHHHLPKQRGFTCCLKTVTSKPVLQTITMYSGSNVSRTCHDYCIKHLDEVSTIDCTCGTNLCNAAPETLIMSVLSILIAAFVAIVFNIFTLLNIA